LQRAPGGALTEGVAQHNLNATPTANTPRRSTSQKKEDRLFFAQTSTIPLQQKGSKNEQAKVGLLACGSGLGWHVHVHTSG
jgi:hypothetical protein